MSRCCREPSRLSEPSSESPSDPVLPGRGGSPSPKPAPIRRLPDGRPDRRPDRRPDGGPERGLDPWSSELDQASAEALLQWAHQTFGDRLAVATSLQAEGVVILDLLHELALPVRVLTVDTGRLPEETLELVDRIRARYRLDVELVYPRAEDVQELVRAGGPNLFLESTENRLRCCSVRKLEPFRRALDGVACWISGLRRTQGGARAQARRVELDRVNRPEGGLLKVNPLLDWSEEQVWERIRERRIPYHALYDRGYRSIGCAPCTRAARPSEEERASRWWWESGPKECGLHPRLVPLGGAVGGAAGGAGIGGAR